MKSKEQTFHLVIKKFHTEDLLRIFEALTPHQIDRLAAHLRVFVGKPIKLIVAPTRRPKTAEALGMYFGAIVPATAMDAIHLPYDPNRIYRDYQYYRSLGKISKKNLDAADRTIRLEWHYEYTRRLDGKLYRVPRDLSTHNNGALLALIEKVLEWRNENGYPFIDAEKYKDLRDRLLL